MSALARDLSSFFASEPPAACRQTRSSARPQTTIRSTVAFTLRGRSGRWCSAALLNDECDAVVLIAEIAEFETAVGRRSPRKELFDADQ